jgi:S-methylmethionine-dependent homocysteine/selenocysteine methylase
MSIHRDSLPQLSGGLFLADGGLETTLIFHDGFELPEFASFTLLDDEAGDAALEHYFEPYLDVARQHGVGVVFETATWRASPDWLEKLGYPPEDLERLNRLAIDQLAKLRSRHEDARPFVISGNVGPRGDGYDPDVLLGVEEAQRYHSAQIDTFRDTEADMVTALTMTHDEEAIGVAHAARDAGLPVVISFTVETDGRLPTGQELGDAIDAVDGATGSFPSYYMINCAHPSHFAHVLEPGVPWLARIRGLRANASTLSHAELDEATELDEGDPEKLADHYRRLRSVLKELNVMGGCCGTDHRHIAAIVRACLKG